MSTNEKLPPVINGEYVYKVLQYSDYSSELEYQDFKVPVEFNAHQVMIKVKATSVNPADLVLKSLSYKRLGDPIKTFGGDFAGVVVKTGTDCKFQIGDKVYGNVVTPMKQRGSFGEYLTVLDSDFRLVDKMPKGMLFEQAAGLPVVFSTAMQGLEDHEDLKGKNVLILGAGTSVGTYAVQLAKNHFGAANVVATCSPRSEKKIKSYGADLTIDYTKGEEFKLAEVLKFVKENGKFDFVMDTVRDSSLFESLFSIVKGQKQKGIFSLISGSSTNDYKNIHFTDMLPTWTFCKYYVKSKIWNAYPKFTSLFMESNSKFLSTVNKMWLENKLQIAIDSEFDGLSEFKLAIDKVASSKASGKVICKF